MSRPEAVGYRQRLESALSEGRRRGAISEREYESLLIDPEFDEAEFENFRAAAEQEGLALAEEPADAPAAVVMVEYGEPERGLLDLYLADIGRFPLIPHAELLQIARRKFVPITFGSDAHAPGEVGMNFAEAVALARSVCYQESCRFTRRQHEFIPF